MKIFIGFFVLATGMLLSCKKDSGSTSEIPATENSLFSKLILVDTVSSDTVSILAYNYDGQKRLSQVLFSEEYKTVDRTDYNYTFSYNGADTIPFMITATYDNAVYKNFLSYNASGKLVKDSAESVESNSGLPLSIFVSEYAYIGNSVSVTKKYYYPLSGSAAASYTHTYDADNIISQQAAGLM